MHSEHLSHDPNLNAHTNEHIRLPESAKLRLRRLLALFTISLALGSGGAGPSETQHNQPDPAEAAHSAQDWRRDANELLSQVMAGRSNAFAAHTRSMPETMQRTSRSDVQPAPSMSSTELGPHLPALPQRFTAQEAQPSAQTLAATERANDLYQQSLFRQGWAGGEVTSQQDAKAYKALVREHHPDLPSTSPLDAEAVGIVNANRQAAPSQPKKEK